MEKDADICLVLLLSFYFCVSLADVTCGLCWLDTTWFTMQKWLYIHTAVEGNLKLKL